MATLRTHVGNLEFALPGKYMRAFLRGLIAASISLSTVVMAADFDGMVDLLWNTKPNQTGLSTEFRCTSDGACVISSSALLEFDYVVSGKQIRGVMTGAGSANRNASDFDLILDASPDNPTEALLKFPMWASEPVVLKRFMGSALQTHSLTGEWTGHVQTNAANAAVSPMAARANVLHLQLVDNTGRVRRFTRLRFASESLGP